ncbi:MAG TPA: hypothetical protein ENG63_06950 [Candidatus Desulfofervidus auxilii]|uniref:Uncharacterized protein n=1 Tax=Desulfofervidus auxilii TaxID=1621989 RepID=A0A7C0Y502_DESA2|nr:hypothetical protein [Candidatus Desulfofervidus auxilii]
MEEIETLKDKVKQIESLEKRINATAEMVIELKNQFTKAISLIEKHIEEKIQEAFNMIGSQIELNQQNSSNPDIEENTGQNPNIQQENVNASLDIQSKALQLKIIEEVKNMNPWDKFVYAISNASSIGYLAQMLKGTEQPQNPTSNIDQTINIVKSVFGAMNDLYAMAVKTVSESKKLASAGLTKEDLKQMVKDVIMEFSSKEAQGE